MMKTGLTGILLRSKTLVGAALLLSTAAWAQETPATPNPAQELMTPMGGSSWMFPAMFTGVGLILLLVGIAVMTFTLRSRRKARTAESWPIAQGTVTASEVNIRRSRSQKGQRQTSYSPAVSYSYTVAGKTYFADRIGFGQSSGTSRAKAETVAARYPAGAEIAVRYDPQDPSVATLETTAASLFSAVLGGVFVVIGGLFTLIGLFFAAALLA
jgi:hypothetical protein